MTTPVAVEPVEANQRKYGPCGSRATVLYWLSNVAGNGCSIISFTVLSSSKYTGELHSPAMSYSVAGMILAWAFSGLLLAYRFMQCGRVDVARMSDIARKVLLGIHVGVFLFAFAAAVASGTISADLPADVPDNYAQRVRVSCSFAWFSAAAFLSAGRSCFYEWFEFNGRGAEGGPKNHRDFSSFSMARHSFTSNDWNPLKKYVSAYGFHIVGGNVCALISYAMLAGLKNDEFDLDRYTAGQYTLGGGIVAWLFSGVLACYELARRTSKSQLSERAGAVVSYSHGVVFLFAYASAVAISSVSTALSDDYDAAFLAKLRTCCAMAWFSAYAFLVATVLVFRAWHKPKLDATEARGPTRRSGEGSESMRSSSNVFPHPEDVEITSEEGDGEAPKFESLRDVAKREEVKAARAARLHTPDNTTQQSSAASDSVSPAQSLRDVQDRL
jgi:hypothetical protein